MARPAVALREPDPEERQDRPERLNEPPGRPERGAALRGALRKAAAPAAALSAVVYAAGGHVFGRASRFAEWLGKAIGLVRTLVVNVAVVAGACFGVWVLVTELWHRTLVIEPVQVPNSLASLGYRPESVARLLKQEILKLRQDSTTLKELQLLATQTEQLDVKIPEIETTLRQVIDYAREIFGRTETRISGEIIGDADIGYTLQLLSDRGGPLPPVNIDHKRRMPELLARGAERVTADAEPYVLALALFSRNLKESPLVSATSEGDPRAAGRRLIETALNAEKILDAAVREATISRLLRASLNNARTDDDAWAHNLSGLRLLRQNRPDEAIAAYTAALGTDRSAIAHFNRGLAFAAKSDYSAAVVDYEEALAIDAAEQVFDARDRFGLSVRLTCSWYQLALAAGADEERIRLRELYRSGRDMLRAYEGDLVPENWVEAFFRDARTRCVSDEVERSLRASE